MINGAKNGVSHARCFTSQKTILFLLLKTYFCRENKSGYKKSKFFVVLAKTSTSVRRYAYARFSQEINAP